MPRDAAVATAKRSRPTPPLTSSDGPSTPPARLNGRGIIPRTTDHASMALCPQCDHSVLVHTLLTDNLAAYSCGKCLGTLVSLVSYRAWRESAAGREALRATPTAIADVDPPDSVGAKKCPKCRSLMSKYRINADKTNRLDYC